MFVIPNILKMKLNRKLKIYQKFRRRTYDNTAVPEIRLEGKWLRTSGFEEGKEVLVTVKKNKLTITLVN